MEMCEIIMLQWIFILDIQGRTGVHASITSQQSWYRAMSCCHTNALTANQTELWFCSIFHISHFHNITLFTCILCLRPGFHPAFTGFTKMLSTVSAAVCKSVMCCSLILRNQEFHFKHTNFCTLGKAHVYFHHTQPAPLHFFSILTESSW